MPALLLIVVLGVALYLGRDVLTANLGLSKVLGRDRANGTHPELQLALDEWSGSFPIKVTAGVRTDAEQKKAYAQGRTTPGPIITNASSAEQSAHGRGAAIDVVPAPNGVATYGNDAQALAMYSELSAYMKARGFVWGGDWKSLVDKPHYEIKGWVMLPYPLPDYDAQYKGRFSV